MDIDKLLFVDYSIEYLNYSWLWLNDSEVKFLTNTSDFTIQDQLSFFNSISIKKNYYIKGIEFDKKPIGACGLKNITEYDAEYWGYIGEKNYWGKGIGRYIVTYLVDVAKEKSIKSIYLSVVESNIRAIKLYRKSGFQIEDKSDDLIKMRLFI